jgi:hypothetical protein
MAKTIYGATRRLIHRTFRMNLTNGQKAPAREERAKHARSRRCRDHFSCPICANFAPSNTQDGPTSLCSNFSLRPPPASPVSLSAEPTPPLRCRYMGEPLQNLFQSSLSYSNLPHPIHFTSASGDYVAVSWPMDISREPPAGINSRRSHWAPSPADTEFPREDVASVTLALRGWIGTWLNLSR